MYKSVKGEVKRECEKGNIDPPGGGERAGPAVVFFNCLFLTYWDVADGKEANPCVSIDCPLLRLTVGLTAVVHKAGVVAFGPGINDAVLSAAVVEEEEAKEEES